MNSDEKFKKYIQEIISEIEKHKWYESEKIGRNMGGNAAAFDWLSKHYEGWKKARQNHPGNTN